MNINESKDENNFFSNLVNYINKERINMNLSKKSDSKFILESPDQSIELILKIDIDHHNIFYDIYLSNYQIHMRQKTITNFEKMYALSRSHGQWHLPKYLPDIWMILDELNNWANKTNYTIKGKILT